MASNDSSYIEGNYRSQAADSEKLYRRALNVFPNGVTHDTRFMKPFPLYVNRAQGSKKWDVDGNEYIDYWVGHGALLLGHNHPEVTEAIKSQLDKGSHYGACHELEIEWGELVKSLIPSAELVRFTNSGTEATMMALRMARNFTGRNKIVKFEGHFHGWHDHLALAQHPPYDEEDVAPGILEAISENIIICPPNDGARLEEILRGHDVAAVILEPSGATFGGIPTKGDFLKKLREKTGEHGSLLIFDEVVTGFRCSPGGAQGYYNVLPDLTSMAKILAGGFPGGALAGKREIMELLEFKDDDWNHKRKIPHQGTYNANPVSASAGVAALRIVSSGADSAKANSLAKVLRVELNKVAKEHDIGWCIYGDFSGFHIYTNPSKETVSPEDIDEGRLDYRKLKNTPSPLVHKLRAAMSLNGVDINGWPGGMVSSAHTSEDVEKTAAAFSSALSMLKEDGEV